MSDDYGSVYEKANALYQSLQRAKAQPAQAAPTPPPAAPPPGPAQLDPNPLRWDESTVRKLSVEEYRRALAAWDRRAGGPDPLAQLRRRR